MLDKKIYEDLIRISKERASFEADGFVKIKNDPKIWFKKRNRLTDYLSIFNASELGEIEAVMLFGRGDFDTFDEALEFVKTEFTSGDKEMAIDYIASKLPLHTYLKNGLLKLKE